MSIGDGEIKAHRAVCGILAQLPERTEPISNAQFMQAMRDIKKRNPELFPGMVFSDNASNCWSTVLEQALFTMGVSGCLHRSPVDMRWYLRPNLRDEFNRVYAWHFTMAELVIIEKEGSTLAKRIANHELAPTRH